MAIPKNMQAKYDEITPLVIAFCDEKLNEERKALCLRLLEKLCRKRPSPLLAGRARTWAAGIVYAIGKLRKLPTEVCKGLPIGICVAVKYPTEVIYGIAIQYPEQKPVLKIVLIHKRRYRGNSFGWCLV